MASSTKLFTPLKVGAVNLSHRIVMAPLTRYRSTKTAHVPHDIVREYYGQRASTPGTLLITEATFIAEKAAGYDYVPGIWSDDQIDAWKKVTDEVHSHKSFIFLQLWALGRAATYDTITASGHPYVAPSPIGYKDSEHTPRALSEAEIKEYVQLYAQAAENAVKRAGFDGVEVHGANGYIIDQFLQSVSNTRTDTYGSSIPNRSRFAIEVVDAVVSRVGADRVGIRLSPYSSFQEMRMPTPDIIPQFTHLISHLPPKLAYIHVIEPRIEGNVDAPAPESESLDFARKAWNDRTGGKGIFLSAGGYDEKNVFENKWENEAVVYGRWFISNPDLPKRLQKGISLTPYNRKTFYKVESPIGYIDYPFVEDQTTAANGHANM